MLLIHSKLSVDNNKPQQRNITCSGLITSLEFPLMAADCDVCSLVLVSQISQKINHDEQNTYKKLLSISAGPDKL